MTVCELIITNENLGPKEDADDCMIPATFACPSSISFEVIGLDSINICFPSNMGNQLVPAQRLHTSHIVSELRNVVVKDNLGGGRFLKTALCVHDDGGLVVVKVYYKRGTCPELAEHEKLLFRLRKLLSSHTVPADSHLWPYQRFVETDRAAFIIRQYIFANLHDHLSTRPFLCNIEKCWIVFQMLQAVAHLQSAGFCHGDLKCENFLVTSWNWVFLADFACYKPTYLPVDNPANFSFYFDTGGRRRCYIAPERFFISGKDTTVSPDGHLQETMDIFSLGCCIAEVFLEGRALFDLSQLLSYRSGEYCPKSALAGLDHNVRSMILHMIQLDPGMRFSTAESYLSRWGSLIFPSYFGHHFHGLLHKMLAIDSDKRVEEVGKSFLSTCKFMLSSRRNHVPKGTCDQSSVSHHTDVCDNFDTGLRGKPGMRVGNCRICLSSKHGNWKDFIHDLMGEAHVFSHNGSTTNASERYRHAEKLISPWDSTRMFASSKEGNGNQIKYDLSTYYPITETSLYSNVRFSETESMYSDAAKMYSDQVQLTYPTHQTWHLGTEIYGSASCTSNLKLKAFSKRSLQYCSDCMKSKTMRNSSADINSCHRFQHKKCNCRTLSQLEFGLSWWKCALRRIGNETVPPAQLQLLTLLSDLDAGSHYTGLVLLAALLCTLLRSCRLQNSKLQCLLLLRCTAVISDDDIRLQRIVPSLIAMLADPIAMIRAAAVEVLSDVLTMLEDLPTSDAKIFQEYIFPGLSMLPGDVEEIVRISYARNLLKLSSVAVALHMKYAVYYRDLSVGKSSYAGLHEKHPGDNLQSSFGGIACLLHCIERVIHDLLTSGRSTTATKQAIMPFVAGLARLIGRRRSTNFLLPLLISCLNTRSWQLTMALFDNVTAIGPHTGQFSLDMFLMPCLEQALKCDDVSIVWKVLHCLTKIVSRNQLNRRAVLKATFHAIPHLASHCISSRSAAAMVVIASANFLPAADTHALLLPAVEDAVGVPLAQLNDIFSLVENLNLLLTNHNVSQRRNIGHGSKMQSKLHPPCPSSYFTDLRPVSNAEESIGYSQTPSIRSLGKVVKSDIAAISAIEYSVSLGISPVRSQDVSSMSGCSNMTRTINSCSALRCAGDVCHVPPIKNVIVRSFRIGSHGTCREPLVAHSKIDSHIPDQNARSIGDNCHIQRLNSINYLSHNDNGSESQGAVAFQDSGLSCPRGLLIAHLSEHRRSVNHLSVSPMGLFFVSSSNDETVKIWDCCRLQRDVSFRSRLTYASQGGKMLSSSFCEAGESIASCSSAGSLHVWRVEYISRSQGVPDRYTGILARRQLGASEGAVLESISTGPFSLIYSSQRGGISGLDLRCGCDVWNLPISPREGILERMICDPHNQLWIMTGSSRGYLGVWDLRFNRRVSSWCISGEQSVQSLAFANGHKGTVANPEVYVASGSEDVELWDVFSGCCRQILRVSSENAITGADALESQPAPSQMPSNRQAYLPPVRRSGCKSVLCSGGEVITAGSDRCIRCWNPSLSTCRIISGLPDETQSVSIIAPPNQQIAAVGQHSAYGNFQRISVDEYMNFCKYTGHEKADRHVCHLDSILHMVSADINSERILITCGRDGIIKSWK